MNFKLEEEKKVKMEYSKLFTSIESTTESLSSNISEVISLKKWLKLIGKSLTMVIKIYQQYSGGHKQLNSAETELIKYESSNITDFLHY